MTKQKTANEGGHDLDNTIITDQGTKRDIIDFIKQLYGPDPLGCFNVTMIKKNVQPTIPKWYRLNDLEQVAEEILEHQRTYSDYSVYYGVQLFKSDDRTAKNAYSVPGVFLDIDTANGDHSKTNIPTDPKQALNIVHEIMEGLPIPAPTKEDPTREIIVQPSIVLDTGGGIHLYWLFDKPFIITTSDEFSFIESVVKQFEKSFKSLIKNRFNYHVDTVADLARILRLPGTMNRKYSPERSVKYIQRFNGTRFTVEQIQTITQRLESATPKHENNTISKMKAPLKYTITKETDPDQICNECPFMQNWRDNPESLSEPDWYSGISILARDDVKEHRAFIHHYSSYYKGYTPEETDNKIQHAKKASGPKKCSTIINETTGEFCKGCKHNGTITSPIVLGGPTFNQKIIEYNLTDSGNAEQLADRFGNDILFNHDTKEWLIWNERYWERDQKGLIMELPKRVARENKAHADLIDPSIIEDKTLRKDITKHRNALIAYYKKSENLHSLLATLKLTASQRGIGVLTNELDPIEHKTLLPVLNGVINLENGELMEHKREHRFTKLVNVEYKQGATCPTWIKFIERICRDDMDLPDQNLVDYIQRAVGYTLSGDMSQQCWFIVYGPGGNGKSTFINILRSLLGPFARQANTATFSTQSKKSNEASPDLAKLYGVRLVVVSESDEGMRLAEGLIKQWTGGEEIAARQLHANETEFKPVGKIWLNTNHKPNIRGGDTGTGRRIRVLPLTSRIEEKERDPYLEAKLMAELPGILNWAVEGYTKFKRQPLDKLPERVELATKEYLDEHDALGQFLNDCCILGGGKNTKTMNDELYREYLEWCAGNSPLGTTNFHKRLKERAAAKGYILFETDGHRKGRGKHNITLKSKVATDESNKIVNIDSIPKHKSQIGF